MISQHVIIAAVGANTKLSFFISSGDGVTSSIYDMKNGTFKTTVYYCKWFERKKEKNDIN